MNLVAAQQKMPDPPNQVGPPRLVDFSCNVQESGNGKAACQLVLKLEQDNSSQACTINNEDTTSISMELEPGALASLLEGLGRIRDQLSSVTNKKIVK